MIVPLNLIGQRQGGGVEDAGFRPEQAEQPRRFLDRQARERPLAQRTVEQQNTRRGIGRAQAECRAVAHIGAFECRQVVGIGELAQRH